MRPLKDPQAAGGGRRIVVGFAKMKRFETFKRPGHDAGFLHHFAPDRIFGRLFGLEPAAGKRIKAFGRLLSAFDQQYPIPPDQTRRCDLDNFPRHVPFFIGPALWHQPVVLDRRLRNVKVRRMCGRFSLTAGPEEVRNLFDPIEIEAFPPRRDIAPTQPILMVIADPPREEGSSLPGRKALPVRWGLIPSWVGDPKGFPLLINACSETAATKNSFRAAMRHRRALIPASGFYEWRRDGGKKPQAYRIGPKNGGIVAFAGLMETWSSADGCEVDTGAILTTASNETVGDNRMPAVIRRDDFADWLDCREVEPKDVRHLLKPAEPDLFEAVPVSTPVETPTPTNPDGGQMSFF